jgi:hypothetical protein
MSAQSVFSLFSPGVGKEGMNELHYAAYSGDLNGLLHARTLGLDVNAVDTYPKYLTRSLSTVPISTHEARMA